jgi:hypothetical protein
VVGRTVAAGHSSEQRKTSTARAAILGPIAAAGSPSPPRPRAAPRRPPRRARLRPGSRRLTDAFIAAYLVVQVAVPLGYYLGLRPPSDERFTWRMFSAVRLDRCESAVTETVRTGASTTARPLRETLQLGWLVQLNRGQPRVVDRVLTRACDDEGALSATLIRRCHATDGTEAPPQEVERACHASP